MLLGSPAQVGELGKASWVSGDCKEGRSLEIVMRKGRTSRYRKTSSSDVYFKLFKEMSLYKTVTLTIISPITSCSFSNGKKQDYIDGASSRGLLTQYKYRNCKAPLPPVSRLTQNASGDGSRSCAFPSPVLTLNCLTSSSYLAFSYLKVGDIIT